MPSGSKVGPGPGSPRPVGPVRRRRDPTGTGNDTGCWTGRPFSSTVAEGSGEESDERTDA